MLEDVYIHIFLKPEIYISYFPLYVTYLFIYLLDLVFETGFLLEPRTHYFLNLLGYPTNPRDHFVSLSPPALGLQAHATNSSL